MGALFLTRILESGILSRSARRYPEGLAKHFFQVWSEVKDQPRMCMRQKVHVDHTATDRQLFQSLEVGDVWAEAEMIQVWGYLYRNSRLNIPSTWEETLANFNQVLMDHALSLASGVTPSTCFKQNPLEPRCWQMTLAETS